MNDKITEIIEKIMSFKDLSQEQAKEAMTLIMGNKINDCQKASFLTALRMKCESVTELYGFASAMLEKAVLIDINAGPLTDTCGSGGDNKFTFNISTAAAFIAAGAGISIAKHGNRSISSLCGSADVLEALGININIGPKEIKNCIENIGIGFINAPLVHPAMKNVLKTRKEMGFKTVFNTLGPVVNPALPKLRVMGVHNRNCIKKIAEVLKRIGVGRALIVCASDGMDEISVFEPTYITELIGNKVKEYIFEPQKHKFKYRGKAGIKDLQGGNAKFNGRIIVDILRGKEKGPKRDVAILNAAAAIYINRENNDFDQAIQESINSVDSKNAYLKLINLKKYTNGSLSGEFN